MSNNHRIESVTRLNRGALGPSVVCGIALVVAVFTAWPVAIGFMVMTGVAAVVQRAAAEVVLAGRD